jgi:predicted RNA-binding Zn-ribbon protein involved in translation (DUF1610 family)
MQKCPKCGSEEVHRSRAKTRWETWRKEITGKRPYRCHKCGWRGWGVDTGPRFNDLEKEIAERALAPDPPNLKGTLLMRDETRRDNVNLQQLDRIHPVERAAPLDADDNT